ncbi:MAG: ArnT family glycosyltransferase [Candidatus Helarchaeota archaeon]
MHTYFNAPNLYLSYGEYRSIRNTAHANMGQNVEMFYAFILALLGPFFLIHLSLFFLALLLFMFYVFLKNMFSENYALIAVLLIFFLPMNLFFIDTVKTDLILNFYLLLSIFSVYLWQKKKEKKYLYFLGAFLGIAMGVKYTAIFLVIPLFAYVFFINLKKKNKYLINIHHIKQTFLSGLIFLIFFSPWIIKNQIYFQAPLYPYLTSREKSSYLNEELDNGEKIFFQQTRSREIAFLKHSLHKGEINPKSFLSTILNQSLGRNVLITPAHDFAGIAFLIFPFYLFFFKNKDKQKEKNFLFLLTITSGYFLLWFLSSAGGAWYAYFGFILAYTLLPQILIKNKKILILVISFLIFSTLNYIFLPLKNINYLSGIISSEDYKKEVIIFSGTSDYINNMDLDDQEKILITFDFKTAFIKRNDVLVKLIDPYLAHSGYYLNLGDELFLKFLQSNSIKYIINSKLSEVYKGWPRYKGQSLEKYQSEYKGIYPSIYEDIKTLDGFLEKHAKELYTDGYYSLYEINYENIN